GTGHRHTAHARSSAVDETAAFATAAAARAGWLFAARPRSRTGVAIHRPIRRFRRLVASRNPARVLHRRNARWRFVVGLLRPQATPVVHAGFGELITTAGAVWRKNVQRVASTRGLVHVRPTLVQEQLLVPGRCEPSRRARRGSAPARAQG